MIRPLPLKLWHLSSLVAVSAVVFGIVRAGGLASLGIIGLYAATWAAIPRIVGLHRVAGWHARHWMARSGEGAVGLGYGVAGVLLWAVSALVTVTGLLVLIVTVVVFGQLWYVDRFVP